MEKKILSLFGLFLILFLVNVIQGELADFKPGESYEEDSKVQEYKLSLDDILSSNVKSNILKREAPRVQRKMAPAQRKRKQQSSSHRGSSHRGSRGSRGGRGMRKPGRGAGQRGRGRRLQGSGRQRGGSGVRRSRSRSQGSGRRVRGGRGGRALKGQALEEEDGDSGGSGSSMFYDTDGESCEDLDAIPIKLEDC